ncbi:isoprenylcysteine carboxylmethyltransferase family protein [Xanthobacteraceae bacterium Astr-EGSB]|uniref:methyltransferase family protein n=1 Tax=Astrobacterium formosum TaxID=3069710 RepID=UPI0027B6AE73|nr:isoprenylcysteine carboxylmethyltransferase family protein [Xanthobacteraceae bacterium Astr-EGSB]
MNTSSISRRLAVPLARISLGSAAYTAIAFIAAGRLDWARGWIYALVFVAASVVGSVIVHGVNPGLLEERAKGMRADTKPFDRVFYRAFLPLVIVYPLVAGLDARFSFSALPFWTVYPGVFLFVLGSLVTTWAMAVNPHAESTVRIQNERGHALVSRGPYAIVRHPIYAGTLLGLPGTALMLGSAWSLVPMALTGLLFVWRTAREDATLRQELAGYADYAETTRDRLVPGVW